MYNEYESRNGLQSRDCYAIGLGPDRHLSAQGRSIGGVVEGIGVLAMMQAHCSLSPSQNVCFLWYTVEVLGHTSNLQCHKPKIFVHGAERIKEVSRCHFAFLCLAAERSWVLSHLVLVD